MTALEIRDQLKKASDILLSLRFDVTDVAVTRNEVLDIKYAAVDVLTQAKEIVNSAEQRKREISAHEVSRGVTGDRYVRPVPYESVDRAIDELIKERV